MGERQVVVDKLRMTYEGIFNLPDLYTTIDEWFEEKGYDKVELKNVESIKEDGKYIEILIQPYKKITDYAKSLIQIRMIFSGIKEVEIEKEGIKVTLNQGKVQMVFDAWLETDYEGRWESKPMFFFLRTLFDKFFFKPYTSGYQNEVAADVKDVYTQTRSFLNLYRYR